ncbi:MAG: dienelactone hydrolase family protein [Pseudomonadota bacterium]
MQGQWITIPATDGTGHFRAYLALAQAGKGPAVVAIQEIFGINEGMRSICDRLAKHGFVAVAPDLFWRQEPEVELTDKTEAEWQKAFALYNGFDVGKGIADITATIAALRRHPAANGKVGAVGYCLGGLLAYLTATRSDIDAAVGYYGVGIHNHLDEAKNIKKPLMLHIAGADQFVDGNAQKTMHVALDNHPLATLHDYPGMDHAFARPDGQHFNAQAAKLADARTLEFFKTHLS